MKKKILVFAVTFFALPFYLVTFLSASNTGASFLSIGTSARAISMGGAYVGVANDISAINYNPAGLAQLKESQIMGQHTEWISDIKHDFLAFTRPTLNGTMGLSVVYLSQGSIEGRDENRQRTGSFNAYDVATTLSYSRSISNGISLGTNLKIIQQNIEKESATGVAVDIGTQYDTQIKNLKLGLSFQNIGPKMTFISESYNLPLTATIGLGYTLKRAITLALDIKRNIYDNKTEVSMGTEVTPISLLALRVGYLKSVNPETITSISNFKGIGGGLGLRILNFSTDYAFVPYGDLGNTHRLSFGIKF
ncbi:MAG: hypothetical protein A2539_00890 [Elusimicrobia bacterium RIFOXYD2_FULL_34_15]|nr:MAG: hypothetical protein A2539_00890 [Elusimicrobia bacterium RIFOXYD2_FULL_34_15]